MSRKSWAILIVFVAGLVGAIVAARYFAKRAAVEECVQKGVRYFSEIDSYPTLSNGSAAEEVAETRCERRLDAFD